MTAFLVCHLNRNFCQVEAIIIVGKKDAEMFHFKWAILGFPRSINLIIQEPGIGMPSQLLRYLGNHPLR